MRIKIDWISPIKESILGVGIIARPLFTNNGSSKNFTGLG